MSREFGADAFLMKPMRVEDLLLAAERALERRQLLANEPKPIDQATAILMRRWDS